MYALDDVARNPGALRAALARGAGYAPLYVKIKLLYGCNLRCEMCNHWREARPRQLTTAQLEGLLDELARLGCRKVHFTGGEPLLRPDLETLVGRATAVGIRPTLTTNATLLDRERARALARAGLRGVNVSIDSPDPATHDLVRGVPGAFARSLEGLKHLRKARARGKLGIALNTVVTRLNFRGLAELPKLALRVGARALRLMPVDEHTGVALRLRAAEIEEWNREIGPLLAKRALRAGLMAHEDEAYPFGRAADETARSARGAYALGLYERQPCFAPFTHALVDHEGRVYVCCMARGEPLLGDLHARRFEQVWQDEPYRRVRLAMRDGRPLPPCASCDDFTDENLRLQRLLESPDEARPGAGQEAAP